MSQPEILKRLDQKLELLAMARPLSATLVEKLREQFSLEFTYNSNGIEGNKLTLKETILVVKEGMTVKGRPFKDHIEAKNHQEAINYLFEIIDTDKKQTISESFIRSLQQIIIRNLDMASSGYRQGNVMITGSKHTPPEAYEIPQLMKDFINWCKKEIKNKHPVEFAALAHHRLVHIHPFEDGNGRTARLFMNLTLMHAGYPLVIILKNDRAKYYRALEKADNGKMEDIIKFIAQAVERSLNIYLKAIKTPKDSKEKWVLLSTLAKESKFSEKYLNLLARSGKLEAHKEGRNWLSSKKALDNYMNERKRKR